MKHSFKLGESLWLPLGQSNYKVIVVGFLPDKLVIVVKEEMPFESTQLTVDASLLQKQEQIESGETTKTTSSFKIGQPGRAEYE